MLEQLGLSNVASKVYLEAIEKPGRETVEIARSLGISFDEAIEGIAELGDAGLLLNPGNSISVIPVSHAVDMLVLRHERELTAQRARLSEYRTYGEEVKSRYASSAAVSEAESYKGAIAIDACLRALGAETESELSTFAPGGAFSREQINAIQSRNEEVFERGIRSRTIYLSSIRNDRNTLEYVDWLNQRGAEVRTAPTLPIRMIISDKKTAVLPLDPKAGMRGIVVHKNPSVVLALQSLFEVTWAAATPLGLSVARDGNSLSRNEQVVLELSATGNNDEEIAQKMGVSGRTVRRIAEKLLKRLGVETRVEAVYRATKNGWL
jgi:DNA-binding CsgD family transcriptional regulator